MKRLAIVLLALGSTSIFAQAELAIGTPHTDKMINYIGDWEVSKTNGLFGSGSIREVLRIEYNNSKQLKMYYCDSVRYFTENGHCVSSTPATLTYNKFFDGLCYDLGYKCGLGIKLEENESKIQIEFNPLNIQSYTTIYNFPVKYSKIEN